MTSEAATLADVAEEFIAAAEDGRARNRNGRRYRPSAVRDLAGCLRNHVVPDLGDLRLRDVQPEDLQRLVDDLAASDLSLSRIRSVVSAIRAMYGYAIERVIVMVSAADGLEIARVEQPVWDEAAYADPDVGESRVDGLFARRRDEDPRGRRGGSGEPGESSLPEMVLSLVVRVVVTVFIIVALLSLAQALLLPA
jgi:hypothetical protein